LEWLLLPFFGDSGSVTGRDAFATNEGADCTLTDIRLVRRAGQKAVTVVIGRRAFGESYAAAADVTFDVYEIGANPQGEVGLPPLFFDHRSTIHSKTKYCDINLAFAQELGLGRDGLAESDANPRKKG
jgi:hypothetical protein